MMNDSFSEKFDSERTHELGATIKCS